jgi:Uma2 family endonuclease
MVATKRMMPVEEFEQMPDDGKRYELVHGELRAMPGDGMLHGDVGGRFYVHLWLHVHHHRLGRVFPADTRFRIFPDQELVYGPDIAFVRADRLPLEDLDEYEKFGRLAPDLVVEVVSPRDRTAVVLDKVRDYLQAGVRLVWVVEPDSRTVTAYAPGRDPKVYRDGDNLDGGEVLPEFSLAVATIFDVA